MSPGSSVASVDTSSDPTSTGGEVTLAYGMTTELRAVLFSGVLVWARAFQGVAKEVKGCPPSKATNQLALWLDCPTDAAVLIDRRRE